MTRRGVIGIAAGVAGLVAAGAVVGLAAEKYAIGRVRSRPDPEADQPYGQLSPDRTSVVRTDDGIPLEVEEVGPADAPLTVVFVHGLALALGSWHYQWLGLADMTRPRLRMVFYDQRSHGRSGRAAADTVTIDQLGNDLYRVLAEVGCPVLVVRGRHDVVCRRGWAMDLARRPRRQGRTNVVTLAAGAHMVPFTHGDLVAESLETFLVGLGGSDGAGRRTGGA